MMRPRLPRFPLGLPSAAVSPAPPLSSAAAPPPPTPAGDFEAGTIPAQRFGRGQEIFVYTTQKYWRACDVYIDPSLLEVRTRAAFSVFVYALTGTSRTLIASGRYGMWPVAFVGGTWGAQGQRWICAARALAARFEVTIHYRDDGPGDFVGVLPVTVVASNEAVEPPPSIGVMRASNEIESAIELRTSPDLPTPEIVGVQAVNDAAAARFLQVHEGDGASAPGDIPQLVWPLGNAAGQGLSDFNIRYRVLHGRSVNIYPSSTAQTLTAVADCFFQVFIR